MLLGFKPQFVPYVRDGSKTHTIRAIRKRPFKPGDMCDCYGDVRQRSMYLIGRWPCVKVEHIRIEGGWETRSGDFFGAIFIEGNRLTADEMDLLAWRDGFRHPPLNEKEGLGYGGCFELMIEFWRGRLPFEGQVIHWARKDLYR